MSDGGQLCVVCGQTSFGDVDGQPVCLDCLPSYRPAYPTDSCRFVALAPASDVKAWFEGMVAKRFPDLVRFADGMWVAGGGDSLVLTLDLAPLGQWCEVTLACTFPGPTWRALRREVAARWGDGRLAVAPELPPADPVLPEGLSERDRLILEQWRAGETAKAIGRSLGAQAKTILNRLSELRARYGLEVVPYHAHPPEEPG